MKNPYCIALLSALLLYAMQATAQPATQELDDQCWELSFEDNFDALSLWNPESNTGTWNTRYIWDRDIIINEELQYYIDPRVHGQNPFSVSNGILKIIASPTPESLVSNVAEQPYVSGVLTTQKSFAQRYGRFEVLAKVPDGKGLWSAFWLLPSFDRWPEGVAVLPEIDVMEYLGHEPRTYHTTLHTNQTGKLTSHPYDHTVPEVLSDDFHLYSVVWTPETVQWYLDRNWMVSHPAPKDFTQPVHFLLNLAVGGSWPGAPDSSTRFPAVFSIDYVRAWKDKGSCGPGVND